MGTFHAINRDIIRPSGGTVVEKAEKKGALGGILIVIAGLFLFIAFNYRISWKIRPKKFFKRGYFPTTFIRRTSSESI